MSGAQDEAPKGRGWGDRGRLVRSGSEVFGGFFLQQGLLLEGCGCEDGGCVEDGVAGAGIDAGCDGGWPVSGRGRRMWRDWGSEGLSFVGGARGDW